MERLADRSEAGRRLADRLLTLSIADSVVLALPRGGVPVAVEVARALDAPLDLLIVRKIGAPFQPELALGALAEARGAGADAGHTDVLFVDEEGCRQHGISQAAVEREAQAQRLELQRRVTLYRRGQSPLPISGRTAVVVDDGAATGATLRAALMALAPCGLRSIVVAVPVAPADTVRELARHCDRLICLMQPKPFAAVGLHYRRFPQVPDEEVMAMTDATGPSAPPTARPDPANPTG